MKALAVALLAALAVFSTSAHASVPGLLSYQGHVTDVSGNPIGNSSPVNRTVTFKLYTAATGGTPVYAESQTVTLSGGDFSVLIGNGTGVAGLPGPAAPPTPPTSPSRISSTATSTSASPWTTAPPPPTPRSPRASRSSPPPTPSAPKSPTPSPTTP